MGIAVKKLGLCLVALFALSALNGCMYVVSVDDPPVEDFSGQSLGISYFNSSVFESTFRHMLAGSIDQLTLDTYQSFTINSIPPRLTPWVNKCASGGGSVELIELQEYEERQNSRGMESKIAKMAFDYFYEKYKEKKKNEWFDPVKNYDLEIIFSPETRLVHKMIFTKKAE